MTYPVLDPQRGLAFTANGRDVVLLWPEDGAAYAAAGLRIAFTQFYGRWRYNTEAGIKYLEEILGFAPPERVLQLLFRDVARKYLPDPQVRVAYEGSNIRVTVTDSLEDFEDAFGLFDPTPEPKIRIDAFERQGSALRIRFTSDLRKRAVPPIAAFEVFGSSAELLNVEVIGRELLLSFSADLSVVRIRYDAAEAPLLQGANRAYVSPFVFELAGEYISTDADAYILTDADAYILIEANESIVSEDGVIL